VFRPLDSLVDFSVYTRIAVHLYLYFVSQWYWASAESKGILVGPQMHRPNNKRNFAASPQNISHRRAVFISVDKATTTTGLESSKNRSGREQQTPSGVYLYHGAEV
jgi:hypothetical protein